MASVPFRKQQNHLFSCCDLQLLRAEACAGHLEMKMSGDRRRDHVCNSFPPSPPPPPPLLPPTYASHKSVLVSSAGCRAVVRAPRRPACRPQGLPLVLNMSLNIIDPHISQPETDGCWITVELSRTPSLEIYTDE